LSALSIRAVGRNADDAVLFGAYLEARDPEVRSLIAERYLPFARKLALRYRHTQEPIDDLVQVAALGLLKAIERYEPARGNKFTSFAAPTILGELKRHFRDRGWTLHVPREIQERALKLTRESDRLAGRLGRSPTVPELAQALECSIEDVLEAHQAARSYDTASLDAPTSTDDGGSVPLGALIACEDTGFALAESRDEMAQRWQSLSEVERKVVALRFVEDLTQQEIGTRIGYSQMHVSRLLRRSMKRLALAA
jgi:RNA polymerase sigma-B factor